LFTISFQLSFLAVSAIILVARPASDFFRQRLRLPRPLCLLLAFICFNFSIEFFLWPATVLNFHQVPWLSPLLNLIFIPLVGALLLPAALLAGLVSLLWATAGAWLTHLVWYLAQAVVISVEWLDTLPIAVSYIGGPGLGSVMLFYSSLLVFFTLPWQPRRWLAGLLMLAGLALWLLPSGPDFANGRLEAWALDVGQGSAVAVKLPDGRFVMADCGTSGTLDPGQRIAAPFLWSLGVNRLEALIVSHPQHDHFSGMPFLLRWFAPRELWINGPAEENPAFSALLDLARQRGVKIRRLTPGRMELGGAEFMIMWPPESYSSSDPNNLSLWLGIGWQDKWLWLSGDKGPAVEKALKNFPSGSHLLMAPHHGGKGSCSQELLDRLRPQATVFSTGCVNSYGMPRPESLARVAAAGGLIYTTANQGCLHLQSGDQGWRITPFLAEPRDCPFSAQAREVLGRNFD
jgi:competence protein ComEC